MAATDRSLHVRMGQVGQAVSRLDIFCLWRTSSAVFVLVRIAFEQIQLMRHLLHTLTCLINGQARLFISQKNSTLPALIRNCPFIKFSKKWHPARLLGLPICKIEEFFHPTSCTIMSNLPLVRGHLYNT